MSQPQTSASLVAHDACVYCRSPLGENDLLERFPVGRRLAFDPRDARLWVVCSECGRWSLSPVEARSEIVEECERHHRGGVTRVASENISLSRPGRSLDLIRVGSAGALELAAWRYGHMLGPKRWPRIDALLAGVNEERLDRLRGTLSATPYLAAGLAVGAVSAAPLAQASALGLVLLAFFRMFTADSAEHDRRLARLRRRSDVVLGEIVARDGERFLLHADQAWGSRLVAGSTSATWLLSVPCRGRGARGAPVSIEVEGVEALRMLRLAMPETNHGRASANTLRAATAAIETAGGPEGFIPLASADAKRLGLRYAALGELPRTLRLSLEIASDATHERSALAGDPSVLEREWREAAALAKGLRPYEASAAQS